jgi:hypothetical protein
MTNSNIDTKYIVVKSCQNVCPGRSHARRNVMEPQIQAYNYCNDYNEAVECRHEPSGLPEPSDLLGMAYKHRLTAMRYGNGV